MISFVALQSSHSPPPLQALVNCETLALPPRTRGSLLAAKGEVGCSQASYFPIAKSGLDFSEKLAVRVALHELPSKGRP